MTKMLSAAYERGTCHGNSVLNRVTVNEPPFGG